MITLKKLLEYEKFHGYYDGYYHEKVQSKTNIISEKEWFLIDGVIQDLRLSQKGLVSESYLNKIEKTLSESFDNIDTIKYLKNLANNSSLE